MPQYEINIPHHSSKSVEALFEVLSDHAQLGTVLGVPVRRIHDGEDSLNGTGSVRQIGIGPLNLEETVTDVVPNQRIDYHISRGGFPIRNHEGRLEFSAGDGGGSQVVWHIGFDSELPAAGGIVKTVLERVIKRGLAKIG
ncbi:MAG: SRPBCC family protein [Sinobacteraceae bacterium]|nr:SRPBCC family protein [Nevskiaceae bacterium]